MALRPMGRHSLRKALSEALEDSPGRHFQRHRGHLGYRPIELPPRRRQRQPDDPRLPPENGFRECASRYSFCAPKAPCFSGGMKADKSCKEPNTGPLPEWVEPEAAPVTYPVPSSSESFRILGNLPSATCLGGAPSGTTKPSTQLNQPRAQDAETAAVFRSSIRAPRPGSRADAANQAP